MPNKTCGQCIHAVLDESPQARNNIVGTMFHCYSNPPQMMAIPSMDALGHTGTSIITVRPTVQSDDRACVNFRAGPAKLEKATEITAKNMLS